MSRTSRVSHSKELVRITFRCDCGNFDDVKVDAVISKGAPRCWRCNVPMQCFAVTVDENGF